MNPSSQPLLKRLRRRSNLVSCVRFSTEFNLGSFPVHVKPGGPQTYHALLFALEHFSSHRKYGVGLLQRHSLCKLDDHAFLGGVPVTTKPQKTASQSITEPFNRLTEAVRIGRSAAEQTTSNLYEILTGLIPCRWRHFPFMLRCWYWSCGVVGVTIIMRPLGKKGVLPYSMRGTSITIEELWNNWNYMRLNTRTIIVMTEKKRPLPCRHQ